MQKIRNSPFMSLSLFAYVLIQLIGCTLDKPDYASAPPQYAPTDSAKNAAENVAAAPLDSLNVAKLPKAALDSNSQIIYMTFDDGPLAPTPYLTQIVHEKQVKITEFAVGIHAKNFNHHLDAMKRSPYIEVANHSYSHAYHKYQAFYANPEKAAEDIERNETQLGLLTKIVRMPGRDIWATDSIKRGWQQSGARTAALLHERGYRVYGWDMEWEHYGNTLPKRTPEQIVAQIEDMFRRKAMTTPNHLVFLGHDEMLIKERGRADLRQMIDMLKERGYIFEFMSHYPR